MEKSFFRLIFFGLALVLGTLAYAVSIEWKTLTALNIGEVETRSYRAGGENNPLTTETSVEFSGPELVFLSRLLPAVKDIETDPAVALEYHRKLEIFNAGTDTSTQKSIEIECYTQDHDRAGTLRPIENGPRCFIRITRGMRAG